MAEPCADINLLFAVLALQNDFVDKGDLLKAMNAWGLEKHRALADILVESGALSETDCTLLDGLVARQLAKHGSAEKSLAAAPLSSLVLQQVRSLDGGQPATVLPTSDGGMRYRILRPHARGGLGEVFVAEDTELRRHVALKEIQAQHALHDASRGRFVLEAEITGGLEHPGIVPVYGLGAYPDGRPYYAMRFIKGDNLQEAIAAFHGGKMKVASGEKEEEKNRTSLPTLHAPLFTTLGFRQLLGRFIAVCNAVAYAHSRGVLHRDLKPGNVMLGQFGETLVVDWGLAKVVGRQHALETPTPDGETTLRPASASHVDETLYGSALGTPAYMSPEQAAGHVNRLGPATDVYSLGATLYNLLTNRSPVASKEFADVLRDVQRGHTGFNQLTPAASDVPRPLVAITRKAMALDPFDRYDSPLSLAKDLERWLADEPVEAYREPVIVRARRWLRKHRTLATSAAAALLVTTIGAIVASTMLASVNHELDQRNHALDTANLDLKRSNDKERQATKLALERLDHVEKANELIESVFKDIDPRSAEKGGPPVIEQLTKRLLATADKLDEKALGDPLTVARLQTFLGKTLLNLGEPARAIELLAKARETREKLLGADHHETLVSMNNLAEGYRIDGKLDQALQLHQRTFKLCEVKLGPDHDDTLQSKNNLAMTYHEAGKLNLALPLIEEAFKARKAKFGPDSPETLVCMNNLALVYRTMREPRRALPLFEELLKIMQAKHGRDHAETLTTMSNLALVYQDAGKLALALPLHQETLGLMRKKLGPEHPMTLTTMMNLAKAYHDAGKRDLAIAFHHDALKLRKATLGPDHHDTLNSMNLLGLAYQDAGKTHLALPLFEDTLKLRRGKLGADHHDTLISMNNLAIAYRATGKPDLALPLFEESVKYLKVKLEPDHPDLIVTMENLAIVNLEARQFARAQAVFEELVAGDRRRFGDGTPRLADRLATYCIFLVKARQFAVSETYLRECLAIREKSEPERWTIFNTRAMLGAALLGQQKYAEGEAMLMTGYHGMLARIAMIPAPGKARLTDAEGWLAELYEASYEKKEAKVTGKLSDSMKETIHEIKLTAARPTIIEMRSGQFDALLRVTDNKGKLLAENDDIDFHAKNLNARVLLVPPQDGAYRVVATSFEETKGGDYEIFIREYGPRKGK